MSDFILYRGDTFSVTFDYVPEEGGEPDLSNTTITSAALDGSETKRMLTVVKSVDNLSFIVSADTADWDIGKGEGAYDVKCVSNGVVWHFARTYFLIKEPIT